ncbi:MAG: YbaN family protein [Pseudomonadota bacterium]
MRNLKTGLWFALGIMTLAFGAVGIALPILPTTPFVILAAFAFGKSSTRFQHALECSRVFGPIISDWHAHGAIAVEYKALAILMIGTVLALSIAFAVPMPILLAQMACMVAAALFIFTRPSRAA